MLPLNKSQYSQYVGVVVAIAIIMIISVCVPLLTASFNHTITIFIPFGTLRLGPLSSLLLSIFLSVRLCIDASLCIVQANNMLYGCAANSYNVHFSDINWKTKIHTISFLFFFFLFLFVEIIFLSSGSNWNSFKSWTR